MKRIWTSLEVVISAGLLVLGLYMLSEGSLNKSTNEAGIVLGGAACFALGAMSLISARSDSSFGTGACCYKQCMAMMGTRPFLGRSRPSMKMRIGTPSNLS